MPTIEVSNETFERIKDQLTEGELDLNSVDDLVGRAWFFRTVTYHNIGFVKARIGNLLVLSQSTWVPSSERFMETVRWGHLREAEPVGDMIINADAIVDAFPWRHSLNIPQK